MKIRIRNLRHLPPGIELKTLTAGRLEISPEELLSVEVIKASVDARGIQPTRVYTLDVTVADTATLLKQHQSDREIAPAPPPPSVHYEGPMVTIGTEPLVVGAGPAGLFLALELLKRGYRPIIIDRGKVLRSRWKDVNTYWRHGRLNPESNVVFGDGGAGTFSDGKLYTRRNDPRNPGILKLFAELGEAPDILTVGRPHLGTNRLSRMLINLHQKLEHEGVRVRFETHLDDLLITDGKIRGAVVNGKTIQTDCVFLATGHSARDIYTLLAGHDVAMEARPFALGARAEHPQTMINQAQLGTSTPEIEPADYMMSFNDKKSSRSAYTFCMCPGGEVVAAATETDGLTVNGMSYSHRGDRFGNAAVVATVTPEDFGAEGPLSGLNFQRKLEVAAFRAGGGDHVAPAQRISDFLLGKPSTGSMETSYRRGVTPTDLSPILPDAVAHTMRRGLRYFGRLVQGYDGPEGILIGLETRTSSPIRVLRDPLTYQSINVAGLYPLGEGAGYAGGIMSSASDGVRAAERIAIRNKS